MKALACLFVFGVALAVAEAPVPASRQASGHHGAHGQNQDGGGKRGEQPTNSAPVVLPDTDGSGTDQQKPHDDPKGDQDAPVLVSKPAPVSKPLDWYQITSIFVNFVLACVGIRGIFIALATLNKLERQTKASEDSAEASLLSAKATRDSVESYVLKERARLRFVMGEPIILITESKPKATVSVVASLNVKNYGIADAFVRFAEADLVILGSDKCDPDIAFHQFTLPDVIARGDTLRPVSFAMGAMPEETSAELRSREKYLHFYGQVIYEDAFPGERTSSFYSVWEIDPDPLKSRWVERKCEGYNLQT